MKVLNIMVNSQHFLWKMTLKVTSLLVPPWMGGTLTSWLYLVSASILPGSNSGTYLDDTPPNGVRKQGTPLCRRLLYAWSISLASEAGSSLQKSLSLVPLVNEGLWWSTDWGISYALLNSERCNTHKRNSGSSQSHFSWKHVNYCIIKCVKYRLS